MKNKEFLTVDTKESTRIYETKRIGSVKDSMYYIKSVLREVDKLFLEYEVDERSWTIILKLPRYYTLRLTRNNKGEYIPMEKRDLYR